MPAPLEAGSTRRVVKRGIVSEQEAVNNGIASANLSAPFIQAGLGEFFTELHNCTRLVQF